MVGGLNDDLEIGVAALGGDVLQGEAVDVALVGNQIEVGVDPRLGRMNEAETPHHIDDPEVLVAGRGLHDLFGRGHHDQASCISPWRGWARCPASGTAPSGLARRVSGCGLGKGRCRRQGRCKDESEKGDLHATAPLRLGVAVDAAGFFSVACCLGGKGWSSASRRTPSATP